MDHKRLTPAQRQHLKVLLKLAGPIRALRYLVEQVGEVPHDQLDSWIACLDSKTLYWKCVKRTSQHDVGEVIPVTSLYLATGTLKPYLEGGVTDVPE